MQYPYRPWRAVRLRPVPGSFANEGRESGSSGSLPRVRNAGLLACAATFAYTAATAAAEPAKAPEPFRLETAGPFDSKLRLEIANRMRGEFVDWFGDPKVGGKVIPKESSYNFFANKFQLGLRLTSEPFEAFAQFQDTVLTGLPDNGVGVGSVYYANTPHTTQNSAFLRQGWAKFKKDGFFLSGGRQLYSDGVQGPAKNKTLKWLQDFRFGQRLIGPFDYTHAGRSFDGGTLGYLSDNIEVSGFAFLPTFGGFNINGMNEIHDITVAGATVNLRDGGWLGNTLGRLSYYYYSDDRGLVATDNRPEPIRKGVKTKPIEVHTVGASAAHVLPLGPGQLDALFYGFGQFGDWQDLDHSAWAYGLELGYQLTDVWSSPWLRAGVNSASGDPNAKDRNHDTFFQLLPTAWLYAQFPFYNMMNNQDVFVQALFKPHSMVNVRLDFHWLAVNETRDLVYSGAGATSDKVFGFAGAPTGGFDDLAYLAHVMVNVKPTEYLNFNVFYGHAFGQQIINQQFNGTSGNYAFIEANLAF